MAGHPAINGPEMSQERANEYRRKAAEYRLKAGKPRSTTTKRHGSRWPRIGSVSPRPCRVNARLTICHDQSSPVPHMAHAWRNMASLCGAARPERTISHEQNGTDTRQPGGSCKRAPLPLLV